MIRHSLNKMKYEAFKQPSDIESVCMARGGKSQYCRNCIYDCKCELYKTKHDGLTPQEFYHKYLTQTYKRKGD